MIPSVNFNQNQQQSFQGLKIKNVAIGKQYIEKDMKALQELGKKYDIKITQGTEYINKNPEIYVKPCLHVEVKPLKRSLNPLVRIFGTDSRAGFFQLAYRKSRDVESSVAALVEKLAEKVKTK